MLWQRKIPLWRFAIGSTLYIAGIKEGTEFDIYVYKVVRWVSYTSKSYTDVYIKKSGRRVKM